MQVCSLAFACVGLAVFSDAGSPDAGVSSPVIPGDLVPGKVFEATPTASACAAGALAAAYGLPVGFQPEDSQRIETKPTEANPAGALPPGVTPAIQSSVQRALRFLVSIQGDDGSWRQAGQQGAYPTAMTALAGMALLGSGSTPSRGPHWQSVRRATDFLVSCADETGLIGAPAEGRSMYGHGFATMFLAQVHGMEEDLPRRKRLVEVLEAAVRLIADSQSDAGGWLYTPEDDGDEGSVTVTQIQSLRACRNAGLIVPPTTVQGAVDYIRKCANPDGSIRYSLRSGGPGRAPITAAAVAVLYNAGRYEDPLAESALKYAVRNLPVNGRSGHYFYAHLYLAQALYQQGGDRWADYYTSLAARLMREQQGDGSWEGDGVGSTYGTAVALTILQLPWALVPIYQR